MSTDVASTFITATGDCYVEGRKVRPAEYVRAVARSLRGDATWDVPPPAKGGKGAPGGFPGLREELRQRPGEWVVLGEYASGTSAASVANHVNSRRNYKLLHGCEAISRTADGKHVVYVRWPSPVAENSFSASDSSGTA